MNTAKIIKNNVDVTKSTILLIKLPYICSIEPVSVYSPPTSLKYTNKKL